MTIITDLIIIYPYRWLKICKSWVIRRIFSMSKEEIATFEKIWKMIWDFLYKVFEKDGWNRIKPVY